MKRALSIIAVIQILALSSGCDRLESSISGRLVSQSVCKSSKGESVKSDISDDQSCITYFYNGATKKLLVSHINAGFNCCPGKILCKAELAGNTLIITERESSAMCSCNCLFDLEIEIDNLDPQVYTVKVIEPYCGDQEKLIFNIDLLSSPQGSFCVSRKQYPWGMGGE